jgi:hypothetical protein
MPKRTGEIGRRTEEVSWKGKEEEGGHKDNRGQESEDKIDIKELTSVRR